MRFRERYKEIIFPVFDYYINKVLKLSLAMEYFSLAVDNVFLQVESHILCYAEILHSIRNNRSQFSAYPEKMIDAGLACEDNSRKIKYVDLLLPEILGGNSFNLVKWFKINFQVIFPG
jgi:hypothetical protein